MFLRCFINLFNNGQPRAWAKRLPCLEFWYHTSFQFSSNCSPFKVVYDREPPTLLRFEKGSTVVATLEEQLLDVILDDVNAGLLKAYLGVHNAGAGNQGIEVLMGYKNEKPHGRIFII